MDGEPPEVGGDEEEDVDNRQHCHLTICIGLDELTNSIRQQDPNIYSDTEAMRLVYTHPFIL